MTNNFKILLDFDVSKRNKEVKKYIEQIERNLEKEELENVFVCGRKILEIILSDDYSDISNLNSVIKDMTEHKAIPSKVKNALYGIKSKANDDAHAVRNSNIPYLINKDMFSVVEFLKQIFIIIKFFVRERNKDSWEYDFDNEYNFNSMIYMPKLAKMENEIEITANSIISDVKPETEELESKLRGIFELLSSNYSFLIPTYQREYTWSTENVNVFLSDISDRTKDKKTHYMGSLAIAVDDKKGLLRLIDGQQRITTSLLLIKVLHEKYKESQALKMPIELSDIASIISKKYINQVGQYGELNYVKKILSNNLSLEKPFITSTAYKNYKTIQEYIKNMTYSEIDEFYTTFIYYFVIAELRFKNDLGQEIQIFENLNSKGTELSQWDLIKNYIYKNIELNFLINNEQQIEQMLNELFVIKSAVAFGNVKRFKSISEFFSFYNRLESKLKFKKVLSDKGKIHKIFAKIWPENNSEFDNLKDLKQSLDKASKLFEIYASLKSKEYLKNSSPLFKFRLYLENTSAKDAHYPLVMNMIYHSVEWEGTKIKNMSKQSIKIIEKFLSDIDKYITRLLVVKNVGQSLSIFFDTTIDNNIEESHRLFISKISEKGKANSIPSHSDFSKELVKKNNWQKEYALAVIRTINDFYSSDRELKIHKIIENPSLEHIFPIKPKIESFWFEQEQKTKSRFDEIHASRIDKIGNYLLLSSSINSKLSNNDFEIKKEIYKKDKTILFSGIPGKLMNLSEKFSFSFDDINERTKQIAKIASPLYKLSYEK